MGDFTTIDPWTQVLNKLWTLLEANATFAAAVKTNNRIKFTTTTKQNPLKPNIQHGDTPEVMITCESSVDRQAFTSAQAGSDQTFTIQITTLDLRLHKTDGTGANNLRWLVYKILTNAGDTLGLDFVYAARFNSALTHYVDPLLRGTMGWVCIINVVCKLQLPKSY